MILTYDEVKKAWNDQADIFNQWDTLGDDEIVEFTIALTEAAVLASNIQDAQG